MTHFVLVPGAWLGGWAWAQMTAELERSGRPVTAVTLSGLGDRAHRPVGEIGQATHVEDVVSAAADLDGLVLVGHSYSGIPSARPRRSWPTG